jgi:4-hydroxy-2-oxoheptanedioate aldolase
VNAPELKARLKAGRPVYGTWSHIPNVQTVEAIGAAGLDFIVFDMEHGPHSFSEMPALYGAAERVGLVPMTRVPSLGDSNVLRTLDSGAKGVVVPHVDGLAAARRALAAMRYGEMPDNRGVATLTRASLFDDRDEAGYFARQNAEVVSVLLIEDAGGLEDLDAICALPGLDVIFLGIYDLAQSLGLKRDYNDARFRAMFDGAVATARRHGVAVGTYAPDAAAAAQLLEKGVRFVTVSVDGAVLRRAYEAIVRALPGRG